MNGDEADCDYLAEDRNFPATVLFVSHLTVDVSINNYLVDERVLLLVRVFSQVSVSHFACMLCSFVGWMLLRG